MTLILSILLAVFVLLFAKEKINSLTLSAILAKRDITPTETEIKAASEFVIKRLLGQKGKP